jgi:hypothetical protein
MRKDLEKKYRVQLLAEAVLSEHITAFWGFKGIPWPWKGSESRRVKSYQCSPYSVLSLLRRDNQFPH